VSGYRRRQATYPTLQKHVSGGLIHLIKRFIGNYRVPLHYPTWYLRVPMQ